MNATAEKTENKAGTTTMEAIMRELTPETKDAVEAMSRVTTSKVKEKTYKLPHYQYVGCES